MAIDFNNLAKLVFGLLVLASVLFAINYVRELRSQNARLHQDLLGKTTEFQKLSDHAAKLALKYKSQADLEARLSADFAKERGALEGRIKVLSDATFLIKEVARTTQNPDATFDGAGVLSEVRFANGGPPVGYVFIAADGRVTSKIYKHEFLVKQAISRDESTGKYTIITKADYVLKSPSLNSNGETNWFNRPFSLKISGGTAEIDPTERNLLAPRFQLWAPHVNGALIFGVDAGGAAAKFGLNFSVAGYGKTPNDLDWKFLHLGVDFDSRLQSIGAHVVPFTYRFWPQVLSNTYIGPGLGWSNRGLSLQSHLGITF